MLKIQNVGVGKYIRSPRGIKGANSRDMNIEVWQVAVNEGNSFRCYPVTDPKSIPVTVDTTHYRFLPLDTMVEQVSL